MLFSNNWFQVDIPTIAMEGAMVDAIGGAVTYDGGLVSYLAMENSFNVIASQTIFSDFSTVALGFCIVLVFVVTTLGNFLDKIENRVSLPFLIQLLSWTSNITLQGDHSACSKPPVDIDLKVAF